MDLPRILPSKIEVSVGSWPAANPVNLERLAKELEETAAAPAIFCSCGSGVSSSEKKKKSYFQNVWIFPPKKIPKFVNIEMKLFLGDFQNFEFSRRKITKLKWDFFGRFSNIVMWVCLFTWTTFSSIAGRRFFGCGLFLFVLFMAGFFGGGFCLFFSSFPIS